MSNSNLTAPEQAAVRAKLFGKDGGGDKKEVKEEKGLKMSGAITKDGKYNNPYSGGPKKELVDKKIKMRMAADASREAAAAASEPKRNRRGRELPEDTYDATMSDGATSAVAKAMFQVFVEKNIKEEEIQEDVASEKKYKVRVIDEKSGKSYVRYADREKITALRAKGLKVEMTEHGDPYEGTKREGKGKMDPVAKKPSDRDGDVNNDGKKDGTDKYIYNRRDAINAAIAKRKAVKEEFLVDGTTSTEGQNTKKINPTNVDNYKTGAVKVMPTTESASKLKELIEKKKSVCAKTEEGKDCDVHGMKACPDTVEEEVKNCGCGKNPCVTFGEGKKEKEEISAGERRTYRELLKAKLRAMGMKNPLIMNMEPGEEETMKAMTSSSAKMAATCEERVEEGMVKDALDKGAEFMNTNPVGKVIKKVLEPAGKGKRTVTGADQEAKIKQNKK